MELSVLVPPYDGAATVERAARSLAVIRERERAEVVVVDDDSNDGAAAVARRALEPMGFRSVTLSALERNNWRLQREIGRALQNQRPRWSNALAWPCDPVLYAKFLAHACASRRVLARDPYAPER